MDRKTFRSNTLHTTALQGILNDPSMQAALAILREENKPIALPLDAPEISSVRAHAIHRAAELVLGGLYELAAPYVEPEQLPDALYGADVPEEQSEL